MYDSYGRGDAGRCRELLCVRGNHPGVVAVTSSTRLDTFSAARQRCNNLLPPPPDRPLLEDFKLALDQLKNLADCLNLGAATVQLLFVCCSVSAPVVLIIKFWKSYDLELVENCRTHEVILGGWGGYVSSI